MDKEILEILKEMQKDMQEIKKDNKEIKLEQLNKIGRSLTVMPLYAIRG